MSAEGSLLQEVAHIIIIGLFVYSLTLISCQCPFYVSRVIWQLRVFNGQFLERSWINNKKNKTSNNNNRKNNNNNAVIYLPYCFCSQIESSFNLSLLLRYQAPLVWNSSHHQPEKHINSTGDPIQTFSLRNLFPWLLQWSLENFPTPRGNF